VRCIVGLIARACGLMVTLKEPWKDRIPGFKVYRRVSQKPKSM